MKKTSRSALLLAFVVSTALLFGAAVPGSALGARDTAVTRALDSFHTKQLSTGGFADASAADSANITPWVILAIVAGQENPARWEKGGKDPVYDYLQVTNLERAAESNTNVPAYYAKVILAYTAMGKPELVYTAGTPRIDLLAKLLTYQVSDGHFSPATSGDRGLYDVSTTSWALLALRAAGQSDGNVSSASSWLAAAQNADGGWPIQSGGASAVDQTAAAIQALRSTGVGVSSQTISDALAYLRPTQATDGGFPYSRADTRSNAESTAWVVQALVSAGIDPASWTKNGHTPGHYLRSLQRPSGAFEHRDGVLASNNVLTSTQVTIALAGKKFPFSVSGRVYAPKFLPSFTSFKPGNAAVFSSTNDVTVTAEYKDNAGGTGIDAGAVRILVDGTNQTSKAKVSSSKLTLKLVDLAYGQHTIELRIADKAGNTRTNTHTITVSYTTSSGGTPGGGGTYYPPSGPPSGGGTPTPTTTLYPTPPATPGATGVPTPTTTPGAVTGTPLTPGPSGGPQPSPSATVTGQTAGDENGGGGPGGYMGATLLAMLPLGAGLSYWLHRRQAAALTDAGRGKLLAGGGTPWQRFKGHLPGTP